MLSRALYIREMMPAAAAHIYTTKLCGPGSILILHCYIERDIVVTFQLIMLINLFVHKNIRAPLFFFLSLRLCEQIIIITAHSRANERAVNLCLTECARAHNQLTLARRMDGWMGRAGGRMLCLYFFISVRTFVSDAHGMRLSSGEILISHAFVMLQTT
jgi:hypothetical protein